MEVGFCFNMKKNNNKKKVVDVIKHHQKGEYIQVFLWGTIPFSGLRGKENKKIARKHHISYHWQNTSGSSGLPV